MASTLLTRPSSSDFPPGSALSVAPSSPTHARRSEQRRAHNRIHNHQGVVLLADLSAVTDEDLTDARAIARVASAPCAFHQYVRHRLRESRERRLARSASTAGSTRVVRARTRGECARLQAAAFDSLVSYRGRLRSFEYVRRSSIRIARLVEVLHATAGLSPRSPPWGRAGPA